MIPNLVQPVPYTNAAASLSAIIPEVLKENNYERWSILMQHYLVAQGLWDVILSSQIPLAEGPEDWIKKNASALFAIKISCGAEKFEQIKKMSLAKDAWDALADLHKPPNADKHRGSETDAGSSSSSICLKGGCIAKVPSPSEDTDRSRQKIFGIQAAWIKVMGAILPIIFGRAPMDLYNLKLTHTFANSVLQYWCKEISTYRDATQLVGRGTISAIFQAIKNGRVKIVIEILKSNPHLIWCNKNLSREILISAIKYRRGGILGFVLRLDAGKKTFLSLTDEDGNNVLHLVAKLPDLGIDVNLFPVWVMQREEVRSLLPRWYQGAKNHYGQTPTQVFDGEHQQWRKEAHEWAKNTANSYILVPVLLVTIMFAALFTVPGGNNEETGIPILLHSKLFSGFLICDVVSLLTASTSMLLFLSILTGSYGPVDLPQNLPTRLMITILLLIISIVTMLFAFGFALTIMLPKKLQGLPVIIGYLGLPIPFLLYWRMLPLAVDVYRRNFGSIIS
ncbi:hypothetical protein SLEP1_g55556 [Rubroshorea leprosula]|uniref:PGG domain-containing protein n=1 Tax=Rubroshorea leprosula TaxID=152421 RepID=A0AAV5MIY2_9ROSI|nr:hypothetical protein SLEP1_g55556 [Rubroshorea leprosula]